MTNLEIKQLEKNLSFLHTISNYAKKHCVVPQTVLLWIKDKKVKTLTISGKIFIVEE